METERRGYRIRGRVQGVGFRWWTRRTGERVGVWGTVRNAADGSVEVHAGGSPEALDDLERWLREGPPGARVDSVETMPSTGKLPDGEFRVVF